MRHEAQQIGSDDVDDNNNQDKFDDYSHKDIATRHTVSSSTWVTNCLKQGSKQV